jgi:hypothetical protein
MGNEANLIPSHKSLKTVIVLSRAAADNSWFNKQVTISFEFCE